MTWQPIETAPKDTVILAFDPKAPEWGAIAVVKWCFDRFGVVHDREDDAWTDYAPTHWMPLPSVPEA